MPNRRDSIALTDAEVSEYLQGRHTLNVATIGPDGQPHLVAMWYGFHNDNVAFWTYGRSQKVANLRRDARLTCLVETGTTYSQLKGVQLAGRAELIDDFDTVLAVGRNVAERYGGPVGAEQEAGLRAQAAKRVVVEVHVDRVTSWDHSKLGGRY
jgi:PPOX class probable F420-dependent enzyme